MPTNSYHHSNNRTITRRIAITVLTVGYLVTPLFIGSAPSAAAATSTDIPAIAGFVAGATGYEHPTSWPPQTCHDPANAQEALVYGHLGSLQPC